MKQDYVESVCAICGEVGFMPIKEAHKEWISGINVRHNDPKICAEVLRRKREADEAPEPLKATG